MIKNNYFKTLSIYILGMVIPGLILVCGAAAAEDLSGNAGIRYEAGFENKIDEDLEKTLISVSDSFAMKDKPPQTIRLLKLRMDGDITRMKKALHSLGYFKAEVRGDIDEYDQPAKVSFRIEPGPQFVLDEILIQSSCTGGPVLPTPEDLKLISGQPYKASEVLEAQDLILKNLGARGHPFPKIEDREIIADHADCTVDITFTVCAGPTTVFGPTCVEGLNLIDDEYMQSQWPWCQGDRFNSELVKKTRIKLLRSGLFTTVDISYKDLAPDGSLPMKVVVTERSPRTVSAGVGYQTDTGPEARVGWEHRNLFGKGEKLEFKAEGNDAEKIVRLDFRKPGFFHRDQSLVLNSTFEDDQTDAYDSRSFESSAGVERKVNSVMKGGLGVNYRLVSVDEFGDENTYALLSLPGFFSIDNTDDLLDPSRGGRLNVHLAPYTDTLNNSPGFFKMRATYSHYFELVDPKWLVLASRVSWGGMAGADRHELPKDELFYAGGGGSVRGYAYQTAGELGPNRAGDIVPLGGRSLFETSAEIRFKVTNYLGFVAFVDGGSYYNTEYPRIDDKLYWGTGLGVRYYSPIGPVRLDVGIPLDKREDIDDDYQIYISLGQAF